MQQTLGGSNVNERDFYYWLRGFFELTGAKTLDEQQVKMIKEHMDLVSNKVTPTRYYTPFEPKTALLCSKNSTAAEDKWKLDTTITSHLTC